MTAEKPRYLAERLSEKSEPVITLSAELMGSLKELQRTCLAATRDMADTSSHYRRLNTNLDTITRSPLSYKEAFRIMPQITDAAGRIAASEHDQTISRDARLNVQWALATVDTALSKENAITLSSTPDLPQR